MSRDSWRNRLAEEKMLGRIDRARDQQGGGPKTGAFEDLSKKKLHECQPGDYIRQVMPGSNNTGPLLRVVDPKTGLLETRDGRRTHIPPRSQVMVQV